jgi:membrane associated rhomboid family serine protease
MLSPPDWLPAEQLAVAGALLALAVAVRLLEPDPDRIERARALRRRFLFGLPVGTLTVVAGVLAVYLLVQGGIADWYRPVVLPFRAWSYLYPLGMVSAGFTHTGPGHLIGNLIATLAFGSVAEYAYGHFPTERGASSFGDARSNPYVRALVVVPGVTVVAGLFTAAFSVGPVIGFSGVVFAYAGFAVVHYPLGTIVASAATGVGNLAYNALLSPAPVFRSEPVFRTPWFAEIALQTHVLGFLGGVLVGLYLRRRRTTAGRGGSAPSGHRLPSPAILALGVLVFAVSKNFWAVYWFRGEGAFVLYRWAGAVLVAALTLLIVAAVAASDRPLRPSLAVPDPGTLGGAIRSASPRIVAVGIVLVATAGLAGPAVPVNLATAAEGPLPGDSLGVRDYEVTYVEDVPDGMVGVVEFEALGESTAVNTSGVVVRSRERGLWVTAVRAGDLDLNGRSQVVVGGVGWREEVRATRTGWDVVGGGTAYRVELAHDGRRVTPYVSPARRAEPVVAGRNVSVVPRPDSFAIRVERAGTVATGPIPTENESVTLQGVTFVRDDRRVFATARGTRVRVASEERYRGRR